MFSPHLSGSGHHISEDYTIKKDGEFIKRTRHYSYGHGRLFNALAWRPQHISGAFLEVNLHHYKHVTALAIQGFRQYKIQSFSIDYLHQNGSWIEYKENGNKKVCAHFNNI